MPKNSDCNTQAWVSFHCFECRHYEGIQYDMVSKKHDPSIFLPPDTGLYPFQNVNPGNDITMKSTSHSLTHWDGVTHTYFGKLTIISSDNGLSPARRQAIIWTYAGILLIRPLGTNFSEI